MCEGVREKRETLGPRERREEEVGERDGEESQVMLLYDVCVTDDVSSRKEAHFEEMK